MKQVSLPKSLTDHLRGLAANLLDRAAQFLDRLGVKPNGLTLLGMLGHILAAYMISIGQLVLSAAMLFLFGIMDALDGSLARYQRAENRFGALLDSVCDRLSEGFFYIGLFLYTDTANQSAAQIWILLALITSTSVSYIRARAESLGATTKNGIFTRLERYIVYILLLLLDKVQISLIVITILSLATMGQRGWYAYRQLKNERSSK